MIPKALINNIVESAIAQVLAANWPTEDLRVRLEIELLGRVGEVKFGGTEVVLEILATCISAPLFAVRGGNWGIVAQCDNWEE